MLKPSCNEDLNKGVNQEQRPPNQFFTKPRKNNVNYFNLCLQLLHRDFVGVEAECV